jgi:hypothetical protein
MRNVARIGLFVGVAVVGGAVAVFSRGMFLPAQVAGPVVVDQPINPPPLKPEVITPEPTKEHVWIPGYWERDPNQWQWVPGHWEKPPILSARWVTGYWRVQENRYHWHPGHWAVADAGLVVNKPYEVPPVPAEVVPPAPRQDVVALGACIAGCAVVGRLG